MTTIKARLEKLEAENSPLKQMICIIPGDHKESDGYNVRSMESRDSQTVHFDTFAELEAYDARGDVDCMIVRIVYASEAQPGEHSAR